MIKHKLRLYRIKYGPIKDVYFCKFVFAYTKDELLGKKYNFGYRHLPLVSETVKDEYLVRVNSTITIFDLYEGYEQYMNELDFNSVCRLHSEYQKHINGKLIIPSNRLDLCIELLQLIIINWNE